MKSRKERRAEARENGTAFEPQYNTGVRVDEKGNRFQTGGQPKTYEQKFGKGYERFNNKFVTIKEVEEVVVAEEVQEPTGELTITE